jgi:hypothetical protein
MIHANALPSDGIHVVHAWEVANAAALTALTLVSTDIGRIAKQLDINKFFVLEQITPSVRWGRLGYNKVVFPIAASDESTTITTGVKVTFRAPFAMTIENVKGSLTTAQSTGTLFQFDIKKAGVTIFSTKPTFDNTEKTTATAATANVLSTTALADDDELTVEVTQVGDGTAKGIKVYLIGWV